MTKTKHRARLIVGLLLVALLAASCSTAESAAADIASVEAEEQASRTLGEGVDAAPDEEDRSAVEAAAAEVPPVNAPVEVDASQTSDNAIAVPDLGDSVWAVVVAGASDPFEPFLGDVVDDLAAAGFETTITNCDVGAAEAIGMQPSASFTVSVYASDEASAELLAAELDQSGLGGPVAELVVQCP